MGLETASSTRQTNGVRLHAIEAGPVTGPLVILPLVASRGTQSGELRAPHIPRLSCRYRHCGPAFPTETDRNEPGRSSFRPLVLGCCCDVNRLVRPRSEKVQILHHFGRDLVVAHSAIFT